LEGFPAGLVVNGALGESVPFVSDAVDELRRIYCGASGYDFAHVRDPKERLWLRDAVESGRYGGRLGAEEAVKLLKRLTQPRRILLPRTPVNRAKNGSFGGCPDAAFSLLL